MAAALNALYEAERVRIAALFGACDRENPVFGEGPMDARLMFIGEAPGGEEAKSGHPFVGTAGKTFSRLLEAAEIAREEVFITNAVKFRPVHVKEKSVSNRTPKPDEVLASLPLLRQELLIVRPHVVATLGNTPLCAVLKLAGQKAVTIGAVHGTRISLLLEGFSFVLFPLYHPASTIYNRALTETLAADLTLLNALLKER
ncbi:MAG: uracil-DNA glycosylase [Clostridiaceae bacterium]|nr:uracil-DNA glycosylase [Eubacteriales bacterium]